MTNPFAATNKGGVQTGILLTTGAGVGTMLAYFVVEVFKSKPEVIAELLRQWGPLFVIAALVIVLLDRRLGELIATTRDNAVSQDRMANAMQEIATKDDDRAREQELMMNHLNRKSEQTLDTMQKVLDAMTRMEQKLSKCPIQDCEGLRVVPPTIGRV